MVARGQAGLESALHDVERLGGKAIASPTDAADPDAVEAAAQKVEDTFGPIDIWVNDAFTSVFSPFHEMTAADFKRVTEVTYLGYVYGTMSALRRMKPRDRGTSVQVGSVLAYRGIPLQSAYCAAKHAIQGFTESVRAELYHDKSNVWITMVQMPAVNTPQFSWIKSRLPRKAQPVPPMYQPEVAAEAVYWAAHHRKRQLFVGASTAIVLTGNKFLPGFGDYYLGRTGFDSQQYDGARDPDQPENLYHLADEDRDYGAHGAFDTRATSRSYELWASEHLGLVVVAALAWPRPRWPASPPCYTGAAGTLVFTTGVTRCEDAQLGETLSQLGSRI